MCVEWRQRGQQASLQQERKVIDVQLAGVVLRQGRLSTEVHEGVWSGGSMGSKDGLSKGPLVRQLSGDGAGGDVQRLSFEKDKCLHIV